MKSFVLRVLAVTLACASAFIVVNKVGAQGPAVANQLDKPTEQVEKNIKVLTGMPQSQLIPVMNYFSVSMGRRCNFCHVNNNGQWDYASDAKPEKNTAREMIKMVLETNKTFFKGNVEVQCFTCHRGRNNPQSIVPLPLALPSPAVGPGRTAGAPGGAAPTTAAQPQSSPTPRPTPTPAEEILTKYVAAIGGQTNIDKVKSRSIKGSSTNGAGNPIPFEIEQAAPNKFYIRATLDQGTIERGFNGQAGWEKSARGVRPLSAFEIARLQNSISLWGNLSLKDQYSRLRTINREKVGDRDAYVVMASRSDTDVERLFFDVETGLLLRRITYLRTMVGTIPEQFDFEDYRDVDGVKLPFVVRVSSVEAGNPVSTRTFTEMKLNGAVDESKFAMPAPAKP